MNRSVPDVMAFARLAVAVDGIIVAIFASEVHAEFFMQTWKYRFPLSIVTICDRVES